VGNLPAFLGGVRMKKKNRNAAPRCPYCGSTAILRSADGIYLNNHNNTMLYVCKKYPICDSYVRVHPGTHIPMGTMANGKLRRLRTEAHWKFDQLYERGLINRRFGTGYTLLPEDAVVEFAGESTDPRAVRKEIEKKIAEYAEMGIDEVLFTRMRNAVYGAYVRLLDDPDEVCRMQVEAGFHGENFGDFSEIFDTIEISDVQEMLKRWSRPNCTSLSVVQPLEVNA
jgi:hypothetical protein